ncbi:MAG: phosphate transport system regulatory protein PhoU, partial [Clostridia bacterium]|nr:phosphate transport system regulatory protein PhoU [Clostridia bacterium]
MSIRKNFEEELSSLKTQLVEMCRLTEQMIADAITALVTRDRQLGKSIGQVDKRVDEYEMDIEKKCMRI